MPRGAVIPKESSSDEIERDLGRRRLALVAAPAEAGRKTVRVGDNYFVRPAGVPTVKASKGTTVTWRWRGSAPHNVTVTRGPQRFRSATKTSGSFSRRIRKRGPYTIVCTIHGAADMSMNLRVR